MTYQIPKIIIDKEFRALIPPLRSQEIEQLEQNILAQGIRDPLVVWQGLLLDGHNRFDIAQKHLLEFKIAEIDLPDRNAAKLWIIKNQLGRRNLTPQQMSYLRGKWYEREKQNYGGDRKSSGQNVHLKTSEIVASQTGVVARTVRRDAEYAHAVDKIAEVAGSEVRDTILSAEVQLSKKDVKKIAGLADDAPELVADVAAGKMSIPQAKRELVKRQRVDSPSLPSDKYRIIYADPPWSYGNAGVIGKTDNYGHVGRHYPSMSIAELCAMGPKIREMTEHNAVLFLWVTSPLLEECFPVIEAWGFQYKTSFVWDKIKHNFGHYNSVRHEFLLICTRGSCTPDTKKLVDSVQSIPKSSIHSQKPEEFRAIIDMLYTHGKRIELFARIEAKRDNWDTWGNEPG